jgi:hypothetical protein
VVWFSRRWHRQTRVAADVRRLISISAFQLEPPHVGCHGGRCHPKKRKEKGSSLTIDTFADVTDSHPGETPVAAVNCVRCHARAAESFNPGVHSPALKSGRAPCGHLPRLPRFTCDCFRRLPAAPDAPSCTGGHDEHGHGGVGFAGSKRIIPYFSDGRATILGGWRGSSFSCIYLSRRIFDAGSHV